MPRPSSSRTSWAEVKAVKEACEGHGDQPGSTMVLVCFARYISTKQQNFQYSNTGMGSHLGSVPGRWLWGWKGSMAIAKPMRTSCRRREQGPGGDRQGGQLGPVEEQLGRCASLKYYLSRVSRTFTEGCVFFSRCLDICDTDCSSNYETKPMSSHRLRHLPKTYRV